MPALDLTPEQVAAAEAAGCSFIPVPDHAVHRYTMQRKVFRIGGRPVLATRGGGLFETAATLDRLVAVGREKLAALPAPPLQDIRSAATAPVEEPRAAATPAPLPTAAPLAAPPALPPSPPPGSPRLRRTRPLPPPAVAAPPPPPRDEPPALAPSRPASAQAGAKPRQPGTPRWLTAGAERRGRAGVHWSTRLR